MRVANGWMRTALHALRAARRLRQAPLGRPPARDRGSVARRGARVAAAASAGSRRPGGCRHFADSNKERITHPPSPPTATRDGSPNRRHAAGNTGESPIACRASRNTGDGNGAGRRSHTAAAVTGAGPARFPAGQPCRGWYGSSRPGLPPHSPVGARRRRIRLISKADPCGRTLGADARGHLPIRTRLGRGNRNGAGGPAPSSGSRVGSGGRIRTTDQGLMSPLLYH